MKNKTAQSSGIETDRQIDRTNTGFLGWMGREFEVLRGKRAADFIRVPRSGGWRNTGPRRDS